MTSSIAMISMFLLITESVFLACSSRCSCAQNRNQYVPREDNLQNQINFDFVKNNIISTSPNGPTNSSDPDPNQIPNLFRLISKPGVKHMANRSRWRQTCSVKDNPPNHPRIRTVQEKVFDSLITITSTIFLASCPVFLARLSLVRTTLLCKNQRKILIFRWIFNFQINLCLKSGCVPIRYR